MSFSHESAAVHGRKYGTLSFVPDRFRPFFWPLVVFLVACGLYTLLRFKRTELVDFAVPRLAATRFMAGERLYRPEDGHYQYKYFPAFAAFMIPFTWPPKLAAETLWFALMIAMTWAFVRLAASALPEQRRPLHVLVWLTLLLNGKYLVKELAFGQFNLPLALLLLGAIIMAQRRRDMAAGALVAAAVFVKPYALVMLPWLTWTQGRRALAAFAAVSAAGLALPIVTYGWDGNLVLLQEWYRTVTDTTAPNLMGYENISFASMWAKWLGQGELPKRLAAVTSAVAVAAGLVLIAKRRPVDEPNYLEGAYFFLLIPLISPQGWDYVLLVALPAYMLLVDRWRETPRVWQVITLVGFALTSFAIYDVFRRTLYFILMAWAASSVGALLLAASLFRMRWRAEA